MTIGDPSPAATGQAQADDEYRTWLLRPVMVLLRQMENTMAQEFADLQAQVAVISGEGGEITQAKDAILAAIGGLQGITSTLQTQLDAANAALAQAQADLAAGRGVAAQSTATLQGVKAEFDNAEQALNDAAAALQPAPAPAQP